VSDRTRPFYMLLALGLSICLVGALLMIVGESVVGPEHSGIAAIVGIIGIGIIGLAGSLRAASAGRTTY
jgi:hypothetical protein